MRIVAGAARIIAVDTLPSKLELARKFGATDVVNAKEVDPVGTVIVSPEPLAPTS